MISHNRHGAVHHVVVVCRYRLDLLVHVRIVVHDLVEVVLVQCFIAIGRLWSHDLLAASCLDCTGAWIILLCKLEEKRVFVAS